MPAGYIIAQIDIQDEKAYAEYRQQVPGTIAKWGGEYLVRGGRQESLEGEPQPPRTVILRFESYEKAKAWYDSPDYAKPKALRQAASKGRVLLVEGAA